MLFFTFSTTQEYYSMPIYPAMAILIGSLIASGTFFRLGSRILLVASAVLCAALSILFASVVRTPAEGDIAQALVQHPEMYTLSLGHIGDLTLGAFVYLKLPLALAAVAFGFVDKGLLFFAPECGGDSGDSGHQHDRILPGRAHSTYSLRLLSWFLSTGAKVASEPARTID